MKHCVAVDMGGTKLAVAVVNSEGMVFHKTKLSVRKETVAQSLDQVVEAVRQVVKSSESDWSDIDRVGVVIPGIYFAESGMAWAPNLWGRDAIPFREELQSRLPAPVVIDSDRAAYVLGEQWLGIGQGLNDVIFLAVGTGIGAGVIAGGRLIRGAGCIAGAVGWFVLNPEVRDLYRQMGCFETEAAGPSVGRRAAARIKSGESSLIQQLVNGELDTLTAEKVVEAARRDDRLAKEVLEETATWLGRGVANLISVLNPQMLVLGGGLMQAGDLMLESIRREAREWAQPWAFQQARIELSRLGEEAGLLGAARLAFLELTS